MAAISVIGTAQYDWLLLTVVKEYCLRLGRGILKLSHRRILLAYTPWCGTFLSRLQEYRVVYLEMGTLSITLINLIVVTCFHDL